MRDVIGSLPGIGLIAWWIVAAVYAYCGDQRAARQRTKAQAIAQHSVTVEVD
ncbi:MAG: hypothetical protein JO316_25485 [Abitibacteriaceae bacterium]|nr:hypothetical protein [Abditibacteriaceae bacterium]MBV9868724.1 hypothetical protein [Abditibacteriaceae bacterium]